MLGATGLRRGDQEREIGRTVGSAEVDGRRESGESDRGLVDVGRATVRDRDAARQPGGRLCFARHRSGDQPVAVGRAACGGEAVGE